MNNDFTAVVLGGDMNSYAVARAFYEEYNIKTLLLGQAPIFPTSNSKIIEGHYYNNLLDDDVFINALNDLQKLYPNKKKILFGNTDYYVRLIIHNRERINKISDSYIIPIVSEEKWQELFDKSTFYSLCEKYDLPYPKCKVFDFTKDTAESFEVPFEYPIFIKASDTVEYFNYEFEGKQKGYKIKDHNHFKAVINSISSSGFKGKFVVQEYIEGNDESMYVYSAYVNRNHKVVAMSGGKILMHDRTPKLIGNYNAIKGSTDKSLCEKLKKFLESIDFVGMCHFDVQFDEKRQDYVIFEMNIRQGRSNYYTCAGGMNLARLIVNDYIKNIDEEPYIIDGDYTVSVVPRFCLNYALKKSGSKPVNKENFYRFGMASYDKNIKRLVHQLIWDYNTMNNFRKYNIPAIKNQPK